MYVKTKELRPSGDMRRVRPLDPHLIPNLFLSSVTFTLLWLHVTISCCCINTFTLAEYSNYLSVWGDDPIKDNHNRNGAFGFLNYGFNSIEFDALTKWRNGLE